MIHTWVLFTPAERVGPDVTGTLCGMSEQQVRDEVAVMGDDCPNCNFVYELDNELHQDYPTSWFESVF